MSLRIFELSFSPSPDVHAQSLAGEAVLLDIRTGVYSGLDEVGTRIWDLLAQGATLGTVIDAIQQEYDVDRQTLEDDITTFVRTLEAKGLVQSYEA